MIPWVRSMLTFVNTLLRLPRRDDRPGLQVLRHLGVKTKKEKLGPPALIGVARGRAILHRLARLARAGRLPRLPQRLPDL